ncbi:MAG: serine/threonine protein phosphatase [Verrucomicrobiota bacterium]
MNEVKDSRQARVRIGYDGRVHKNYLGAMAKERYANEKRVLEYLAEQGCDFVPKVLDCEDSELYLVTTNCGKVVERLSERKVQQLLEELEEYGVRHGDRFARNITYSPQLGRFCIIDFEFAEILATGEGLSLDEVQAFRRKQQREQEI